MQRMGRMKMQVRKKNGKSKYECANMENASTKNEVEMLAQASTYGATID